MKTEKLLIIDGSSMLSTSYYGNLPKSILFAKTDEEKEKHYKEILHTSDGVYTNGIFTMMKQIKKTLDVIQPEYVAFTFDVSRNTFRREMFADYKAQRKSTPEPLKEQFVNMEQALIDMGFKVFMDCNFEADDFSASLVKQFESETLSVLVLTKDHDYFQLVSPYTRMLRPMQKDSLAGMIDDYSMYLDPNDEYKYKASGLFEYTEAVVKEEEGVRPDQIVDLLAIVGDPGDGIPGCKGVSSAASLLLSEYENLDNIYEVINSCENNAKQEKELSAFWKEYLGIGRSPIKALKENREIVYLSRKLAQMKCDLDLQCTLEDLRLSINMDGVRKVLDTYEFESLKKDWLE